MGHDIEARSIVATKIAVGSVPVGRFLRPDEWEPELWGQLIEARATNETYLGRPWWARWTPIGRWWMRRHGNPS